MKKHYQFYLGINIFLILVVFFCLSQPLMEIPELAIQVTGFNPGKTSLGKIGILQMIVVIIQGIFFAMYRNWALRANIFTGLISISWALRNYYLLSTCRAGTCPQLSFYFYIYFICVLILFFTCLQKKV